MNHLHWRTDSLRDEEGILIGSDLTQEWLLPWWWNHYRKHNDHPVAFVDFGLSFEMKDWCRERGELIPLRIETDFVKKEEELNTSFVQYLKSESGNWIWKSRDVWFQKPLACLQSPFSKTIWIDLDCEIRKSIAPLFKMGSLAIALDPFESSLPFPVYNSGVVVFSRNHPMIQRWAEESLLQNDRFRGDQELLSALLFEHKTEITRLPSIYNRSRRHNDGPDVVIFHWHGDHGRAIIRHTLWMENSL